MTEHVQPLESLSRPCRILVVDDHQTFRRFVLSLLSKHPSVEIVGDVQDGVEAVQQSEMLQPDVVLLDIGLPRMNGIEAARQITRLVPGARIVFLTQECSRDVVQAALGLGAWGYVLKTQAGSELLMALETVRQGERFVSSGIAHSSPDQP